MRRVSLAMWSCWAFASSTRLRTFSAASPVYRASYAGLLKVFFDLFPQDALAGRIGVPILTGASPAHLAISGWI